MTDNRNAGQDQNQPESDTSGGGSSPNANQPHRYDIHQSAESQKEASHKWGHNPDTWMVVLTGLLMFLGIVTAWIFYRQFREMSKQTGILNGQAQQAAAESIEVSMRAEHQLVIAQQQAKAAQDSVRAIQWQTRQDQRPWIKFEMGDPKVSPTVTWEVQVGSSLKAPVRFANVGKTPAINVKAFVMVDLIPRGVEPRMPTRFRENAKRNSPHAVAGARIRTGTIFPNGNAHDMVERLELINGIIRRKVISVAEAQAVAEQNAYLIIFGLVSYSDGFGVHHWSKFCRGGFANGDDANSGNCANYNAVDNN